MTPDDMVEVLIEEIGEVPHLMYTPNPVHALYRHNRELLFYIEKIQEKLFEAWFRTEDRCNGLYRQRNVLYHYAVLPYEADELPWLWIAKKSKDDEYGLVNHVTKPGTKIGDICFPK